MGEREAVFPAHIGGEQREKLPVHRVDHVGGEQDAKHDDGKRKRAGMKWRGAVRFADFLSRMRFSLPFYRSRMRFSPTHGHDRSCFAFQRVPVAMGKNHYKTGELDVASNASHRSLSALGNACRRASDSKIPIENLLPGPKHYVRARLNMFERLPEVAKPMGYAHDIGVRHQRHDSC